jgi:hypothetical protein
MNPKNPAWQPLDVRAGILPGEIESALGVGGSPSACVVILVDSEIDRDWGAQASLAVAKGWAAYGHRVILADGCLDGPVLHEAAGVENGEGVSDMVLYGASAQRFAGRVEDRLMLAPAGTPVAEVSDVLEHVRWDMMISGCREVGATLVCHVSTGTPGVEAMTKRAEAVLVLAPPSKDVDALLGSTSGPIIAILGPENGAAPPVATDEEGDAVAVEVAPEEVEVAAEEVDTPPESLEEEVAVPVEASAPPEEEAPAVLTVDDLPELPESVDDEGEADDSFSVSGLEGAQYQEEDSPGVGTGTADPDSGVDVAVESPVAEVEGPVGEVESPVGEEVADVAESQEDVEGEAFAAGVDTSPTPDADTSLDTPLGLEGFEAGAGVGLGGPLDDVEGPGDGIDFGSLDLRVAEPVESEAGPTPTLEAPAAFSDAISELVVEEPPEEEAEAAKAAPARRRKYRGLARLERERRRSVILRQFLIGGLTLLIAGGGGLAAAYYGLVNIPGITPPERVRSYVPAPVVLPGPTPRSPIMTHVLMIDAWSTVETPLSTAEALRSRLPDLLFFVTPIEVDGTPQFALYVGPAYSAVEANALKGPIAVVLDRLNPDDWLVRDAPYAFYFGEYDTAENAQGRVDALAAASITAYSLQIEYPDGTSGLRVYGGAFTDEFEASRMGRMVSGADIGGLVLTFRHGTVPE